MFPSVFVCFSILSHFPSLFLLAWYGTLLCLFDFPFFPFLLFPSLPSFLSLLSLPSWFSFWHALLSPYSHAHCLHKTYSMSSLVANDNTTMTIRLMGTRKLFRIQTLSRAQDTHMADLECLAIRLWQDSLSAHLLEKRLTNGTVSTIGSDKDVGVVVFAVVGPDHDAVLVLLDREDLGTEGHFLLGDFREQESMQVSARHDQRQIS